MVAAIANGAAFTKGRDFAAWLGLVPKQMSTGDRTILGRISKRGNRYLRTLCKAPASFCSGQQIGQNIALGRG
jgi:transposase